MIKVIFSKSNLLWANFYYLALTLGTQNKQEKMLN